MSELTRDGTKIRITWEEDEEKASTAMAQAATMGPPLSPREPRRSGRRSAPFASRSPDSEPIPRQKDFPLRPALVSTNSNSKNKRPKQEEQDDPQEDRKIPIPHSASSTNGSSNGRSKRKTKDRDKHLPVLDNVPDTSTPHPEDVVADVPEEEEQGITRCVCGSTGELPSLSVLHPSHRISAKERTTRMLASSWFSARRAKFGSMGYVWATNQRIKFTTTIIIANYAALSYIKSFSSMYPPVMHSSIN